MHGIDQLSMYFFQVGGPARDETDEMHRQSNALIHGWGKYHG